MNLTTKRAALYCMALLLGSAKACPNPSWPGDGWCDSACNDPENSWDGGDCCERSCVDADYDCGISGYDCKDPSNADSKYLFRKEYSGFELTLQCDKDAGAGYAVRYFYTLSEDREDLGTKRGYTNDESVPPECQQQFGGGNMPSYKTKGCSGGSRTKDPDCYDRGHVIAGSHSNDESQMRQDASYVTNLLPQVSRFNQGGGSWYETEEIIECHRDFPDVKNLDIFGGMTYDDVGNDLFLDSHGIPTPDVYYKVVVKHFKDSTKYPDVIAWVMKNEFNSTAARLDMTYNDGGDLIEAKQLKRLVSDPLSQLPDKYTEMAYQLGSSWDRPKDCTKGDSAFAIRDEL